jgi:hypothetical protein
VLTSVGVSRSVLARRPTACRGEGGIRTPDAGITDVTVFETAAFNHSATSPRQSVSTEPRPFNRFSPRSHLTTLYLDLRVTHIVRFIPFFVYRSRPKIRVFRDKRPAHERISEVWKVGNLLPVVRLTLTLNFRDTVYSSSCVDEVIVVQAKRHDRPVGHGARCELECQG